MFVVSQYNPLMWLFWSSWEQLIQGGGS